MERRESVADYPQGRSAAMDALYSARRNAAQGSNGERETTRCGTLPHIKEFDAAFFGISPREAALMDPQQRMLLELAWEALEDAGVSRAEVAGSDTGVYAGAWLLGYLKLMHGGEVASVLGQNGGGQYSISGRLAYVFDLRGPDVAVNLGCASGLAAVHLACEGLRSRECGMALAAGVNAILDPDATIAFTRGGVLSPDGRCKFGDAAADGFVRGEGAGVFVLKLLAKAVEDGDRIHAVIRGSAVVNSGGSSGSLTTPSRIGQAEVLRRACAAAGVSPAQLDYVEAHGTGTAVGDPIEISALSEVIGHAHGRTAACAIGSVKSNIGHSESASGVAGMMKTVFAMKHRFIPASLHLRELNPKIDWEASGLRLETLGSDWPKTGGPALAGVSSFGLTGTNVHLILEEAPADAPEHRPQAKREAWVLPITAHTDAALRQLAACWPKQLRQASDLADLCFTAATRRTALEHRLCVTGADAAELATSIEEWLRAEKPAGVHHGVCPGKDRHCVFVFPGQGAQWAGMGQELHRSQPVFHEALEECSRAIQHETGWSLPDRLFSDDPDQRFSDDSERLFSGEAASALNEVSFVQPSLFAIQVALARLWMSWGVVPDAVVGHSMGEVAAAHIAGALSLPDAVAVICRRSRLLTRVSGQGAMALLELTMEEAAAAVRGAGVEVSVAASNGQRATVVSGDFAGVRELVARLERRDVFCRVIKVDVASHSPQMDPLLAELEEELREIRPKPAKIPILSTVLGANVTGQEMDAAYWARNLREPVLFYPVVQQLLERGMDTFLEMSPHPTLSSYVEQAVGVSGAGVALSSLRRQEPELAALFNTVSELYVRGHTLNWKAVYPAGNPTALPPFPWQRQTFWLEEAVAKPSPPDQPGKTLLGEHVVTAARGAIWTNATLARQSWLRDHVVGASALMPASVYVQAALEAGRQQAQGRQWQIEQLFIREATFLPAESSIEMQTLVEPESLGGCQVRFFVRTGADKQEKMPWTLAASASIMQLSPHATATEELRSIDPARFWRFEPGEKIVNAKQHRETMAQRGYNFGPSFLCLGSYVLRASDAHGQARLPAGADAPGSDASGSDAAGGDAPGPGLHAVLLDAGLQLLAALCYARGSWRGQLVPVRFGSIQAFGPPMAAELVLVRASLPNAGKAGGDVLFYSENGELALKISGVVFKSVERDENLSLAGMMYGVEWELAQSPRQLPKEDAPGSWLIFSDSSGLGAELGRVLSGRGNRVAIIAPQGTLAWNESTAAFEEITRHRGQAMLGVVDLRACDIALDALTDAAANSCAQITELVRSLTRDGIDARLWLVTRSAEAIPGDRGEVSIAQAAITGLAAVIANEHPELQGTSIDLSSATSPADAPQLAEQLLSADNEGRVALREAARWVARMKPLTAAPSSSPLREVLDREAIQLIQRTAGDLDSLLLASLERRAPTELEIEIEVHAAGLSFRDVMQAMGLIEEPSGDAFSLGFEAAGIVTRVGVAVKTPRVGDAVMAISSGIQNGTQNTHDGTQTGTLFATHAILPAALAVPKPDLLSMAEAAALPGAYLTAFYGLVKLARLQKGETVLIHAAAGGVGLAAVQIAQWLGAEIFATAGSDEKRSFLRQLGIVHVMDSRLSGFGRYIDRATGGAGVDVVLNSLAGDAVTEGMRALAPYGRFVEIGKRDMWRDSAMGMSAFMRNRSFMGLDLAGMAQERPDMVAGLLREITSLIGEGSLAALPVKIFPASQAAEAFRFMAEARQIGKVVLNMHDPEARIETESAIIKADATYLITGGTGALGLESARELVELGARHLVLTSRSEPSVDVIAQVAAFEGSGVGLRMRRADAGDEPRLREVLLEIQQSMPPLRGVIHAAGVLDDAMAVDLDQDRFQTAMTGKSQGAMLLDRLTRDIPLDFFVMYSSIAGLLGPPGQGNYAAANTMLDALAYDRARRGLPAMSIAWGPWSDVGLAAQQQNRGKRLADRGLPSISPAEGRMLLRQALIQANALPPQVVLSRVNRAAWLAYAPAAGRSRFLAHLPNGELRENPAYGSAQIGEKLRALSAEDRLPTMLEHLREQAATVVRMKPSEVPLDKPLRSLGLDSLMGVELRQRLEKSLGLRLSSSVIWNYPTITELGRHLAQMLDTGKRDPAKQSVIERQPPAESLHDAKAEPDTASQAIGLAELTAFERLSKEIMEAEGLLRRA